MEKITFKLSINNAVIKDARGPIEDDIGANVLLSEYGAGRVVGMEYVDDGQFV